MTVEADTLACMTHMLYGSPAVLEKLRSVTSSLRAWHDRWRTRNTVKHPCWPVGNGYFVRLDAGGATWFQELAPVADGPACDDAIDGTARCNPEAT